MQADNFDHTLTALRQRVPFRPFTVALVNGDRFEVDHPNALVVRDGVPVFIGPGGIPIVFDREGVSQFGGDLMGQTPPKSAAPSLGHRRATGCLTYRCPGPPAHG